MSAVLVSNGELRETSVESVASVSEAMIAGIHFFILADLLVFAALFAGFMAERSAEVTLFNQSAGALDPLVGILNTLILVSSGLCVLLAVNAAREGRTALVRGWLLAAIIVGSGFGVSKLLEYSDKITP
jgi:nitric oxide reductase NorE protein